MCMNICLKYYFRKIYTYRLIINNTLTNFHVSEICSKVTVINNVNGD